MPIQSKENLDVRNQLGHQTKSLGSEIRTLQLEVDPDDTENFAKQLEESIGNLTLCVIGFKQNAVRYNDDKYLKQAEQVEKN